VLQIDCNGSGRQLTRAQQSALKLTENYNNSNGFPSNNRGSPRASLTQKGSIKSPMALFPVQKKKKISNVGKIVCKNINNNCTIHLFYLTVLN
jgi:hypothetical protein